MSQILMCSKRGTTPTFGERVFKKWISDKKTLKSFVSKTYEGQKISSCKGTNTIWVKKHENKVPDLPTKRVLVVDKGTRRIII